MITTTSLKHPTMQIKIKSCRVQAMMGLVGKLLNTKGKVIMVAVVHKQFDEPTFYLVDKDGQVGKDVTVMVLEACPYGVVAPKKSIFQRVKEKTVSAVEAFQEKISVKAVAYIHGLSLMGFAFS
jgi:hypothetical protein